HHYFGQLGHTGDAAEVELLIEQETDGVSVEFWSDASDLFRLGFTSPLGETISPLTPVYGSTSPPGSLLPLQSSSWSDAPHTGQSDDCSREFSFLLERSRLSVTWSAVGAPEQSSVILLRFTDPTPGIWRIRIESLSLSTGQFHLWLPASGLVSPGIRFLTPNEDTTLVIPACAWRTLAVGTWNAYSRSLYPHSGRGYTRNGLIRPDLVSPGVRITHPASQGGYSSITGSCAASALTAGAAALLLESGLRQNPPHLLSAEELRERFLGGVRQDSGITYPNPSWGYGILNVFSSLIKSNPVF
ncbi:MAG: S8 family serine peptidase, partial [Lachnospiraceae bacterium]|nr:S8 family serine peptidase [Lachnospiraceae bacterium]